MCCHEIACACCAARLAPAVPPFLLFPSATDWLPGPPRPPAHPSIPLHPTPLTPGLGVDGNVEEGVLALGAALGQRRDDVLLRRPRPLNLWVHPGGQKHLHVLRRRRLGAIRSEGGLGRGCSARCGGAERRRRRQRAAAAAGSQPCSQRWRHCCMPSARFSQAYRGVQASPTRAPAPPRNCAYAAHLLHVF